MRAFDWLAELTALRGDEPLEWRTLARGFDLDGERVPLLSQQGIFKPAVCDLPLSIRTSADSPYDDHFIDDRLAYRYRGTDPDHRENVGLRRLMREHIPLVYLHAVVQGRYLAWWPVLVVGDEPGLLRFWIQGETALEFGGAQLTGPLEGATIADESARRRYVTRLIQARLHQRGFRERVLRAYLEQCAMCRLRQRELLDAAHIKPDTAGGQPVVPNGLALCKIHHTAFDVGVLGVRPTDLRIRVRPDILRQIDGPMLRHGLQGLDGQKIRPPRSVANHPDPELLRWKWERFERAG
jgi:putative restriction endonuclease